MNAQNIDNKPKVQKDTKKKIRVEFDRTPLKERLKAKFLSTFFLSKVVFYIFRLVLLVGISYLVLFPFFSKISGSLMAPQDFADGTFDSEEHFVRYVYGDLGRKLLLAGSGKHASAFGKHGAVADLHLLLYRIRFGKVQVQG